MSRIGKLEIDFAFFEETSHLSHGAQRLLLFIAQHMNGHSLAWPSHDTIQAKCKMSKNSITKYKEELELNGYIRTRRRKRSNGFHAGNEYYVHCEHLNVFAGLKQKTIEGYQPETEMLETLEPSPPKKWDAGDAPCSKPQNINKVHPKKWDSRQPKNWDARSTNHLEVPTKAGVCVQKNFSESKESSQGIDYDAELQAFGDFYPGKLDKAARAIFIEKRETGHSFEDLCQGALAYAEEHRKTKREKRYVKLASNWLREEKWKDYLSDEAPQKTHAEHVLSKPLARYLITNEVISTSAIQYIPDEQGERGQGYFCFELNGELKQVPEYQLKSA